MPIIGSHISCGVHQHYGLGPSHRNYGSPARVVPHMYLDRIIHDLAAVSCRTGIVAFSDADMNENGRHTAQEIREYFPDARLVETTTYNPNSGNRITAYLWAPDWGAVAKYCLEFELAPAAAADHFKRTREIQRSYEPTPRALRWE